MRNALFGLACGLLVMGTAGAGGVGPTFTKAFAPATIGPGSVSVLTFTINNADNPTTKADNMAFTDSLPAAVTIANPRRVVNLCGGTVSAPAGGGTISLTGGGVGGGQTCTISVDVTASTPGAHSNTSGALTSSFGTGSTATATLTVATDRPGFSKAFSPNSVSFGGTSTLTFTIDNTSNAGLLERIDFSDALPAGLQVASPANASSTCGTQPTVNPQFSPTPGSASISFSVFGTTLFPALAAGATCTASVDVVSNSFGDFANLSSDLVSEPSTRSSGLANALLQVPSKPVNLSKTFVNDPVAPTESVNLTYRIFNFDRNNSTAGMTFSDNFSAVAGGLTLGTALPASPCGAGSSLSFISSVLTLTSGTLAPDTNCQFTVNLVVPGAAAAGSHPSTSSNISGTLGGSAFPAAGNESAATDTLVVKAVPRLTKSFTDDPVGAGGVVNLQFTLSNPSPSETITGIAFTDDFDPILPTSPSGAPAASFCNGSGSATFTPLVTGGGGTPARLSVSGVTLAPGASCNFSITLDVVGTAAAGNYVNTTSDVTGTTSGPVIGPAASDTLVVVAAPSLTKEFLNDPVIPGATVNLQFKLTHAELAPATATAVTFTDNLAAALAGLTATGLPQSVCGGTLAGSAGDTFLTLSGATLTPGETCTFTVSLTVPADANAGSYTNTTSAVSATVSGVAASGNAATDTLAVHGLSTSKSFTDDPVFPGGTVSLRYTLNNLSVTDAISALSFTDNFAALAGGATITGVPSTTCGGTATGTTQLTVSGAGIAANSSCQIDVSLQVPGNAAAANYGSNSSAISATQGASAFTAVAMKDTLTVSDPLQFSKSFTNDPVAPGTTVTLRYTVQNLNTGAAATAINFTDDLNAALTGLAATGLPAAGCGGTLSGTSQISFSGGSLTAGNSCTMDVTLSVPAGVGGNFVSTSSVLGATFAATSRTASAAVDTLAVFQIGLSAAFVDPIAVPGGAATLQLTLSNVSGGAKSGLGMSINLGAAIAGMTASSLPASGFCGASSTISGTGLLNLANMSLATGGNCVISIPLLVPAAAAAGSYTLNTSTVLDGGLAQSGPGSASLTVVLPTLGKAFSPTATAIGGVSTLTFTVNNSGATVGLTGIAFSDNLPAGLVIAPTPNASKTCAGGMATAVAGATSFSYSGGTLAAGASCTVQVDVQPTTAGDKVNTSSVLSLTQGALTATSTATLNVSALPTFAKAFAPLTIYQGAVSTLTFTITNSAGTIAMPSLAFTDTLPAGVVVAATPNAATTCTGGTLTAAAGAGSISYSGGSVAAGASCTVTVDVTAASSGTFNNTSSVLSTGFGTVPTATASLTVAPAPTFAKAFAPSAIVSNGVSTLTFTINNSASTLAASSLSFTDTLPSGVTLASTPNASTTCTGGTLTAAVPSTISYSGGSVAAGATCTVQVDVTAASNGSFVNTSGDLTSVAGNSGTASATLVVADAVLVLSKTISPLLPKAGNTLTVNYTLLNSSTTLAISGIAFNDDFGALIAGSAATGLPVSNVCGAGSSLSGTGNIALAGGQLAAGAQCSFSVQVVLAGNAPNGSYTSTTSAVTGTTAGGSAGGGAASASFDVVSLPLFSKAFAQTTIATGTSTSLTHTINNSANTVAATGLAFTDALPSGLQIASPANASTTCTGGSLTASAGGSSIVLAGASVASGASCTVTVNVTAPAAGSFVSPAASLSSNLGTSVSAAATLTAATASLSMTKSVNPGVILPAGEFVLTYQISNTGSSLPIDQIAFTDDVIGLIPGTAVVTGPVAPPCGAGSTFTTGATFALTGGNLAAGTSCQFAVRMRLLATTTLGTRASTSSQVSSNVGGSTLTWPAAAANITVGFLSFTKTMPEEAQLGDLIDLRFFISNPDTLNTVTGLSFTDDLNSFLPGSTAEGLPQSAVCGASSTVTGTQVVSFQGGSLAPGASCSFTVRVRIPSGVAFGNYQNRTSALTGLVGGAAINGGAAGVAGAPLGVGFTRPTLIPSLNWLGLLSLIGLTLLIAGVALQRRS